uniref:Uncharacterized protein n=1 Tax=Arabidopsis thaliana TaxID=3702 RepID=Q56XV7_ARATH|nr:hypothetical protein [Arabidopsis thaliana]
MKRRRLGCRRFSVWDQVVPTRVFRRVGGSERGMRREMF